MSNFDPVTLFFILHESLGHWLWLLFGLAFLLLLGIIASIIRLRRSGRSIRRPLLAAVIIGLLVAAAATFAVPGWTLAEVSALSTAVDYAIAFLVALVPGVIVAALVFILAAHICAAKRGERRQAAMP